MIDNGEYLKYTRVLQEFKYLCNLCRINEYIEHITNDLPTFWLLDFPMFSIKLVHASVVGKVEERFPQFSSSAGDFLVG